MEKSVNKQIRFRKKFAMAALLALSVGLIAAYFGALTPDWLGGLPKMLGAVGVSRAIVGLFIG